MSSTSSTPAIPGQQDSGPASFKEQLDHKAHVARDPNYGKEEQQKGLLGKGEYLLFPSLSHNHHSTQHFLRFLSGSHNLSTCAVAEYVPAVASMILPQESRSSSNTPPSTETATPPGPPNRPEHDDKIEDFVRDQHRSKPGENGHQLSDA